MNHSPRYNPDYSDSILSIFDIGAVLFPRNSIAHGKDLTNGLELDMQNLMRDQQLLENDFRNASERVWQEMPKEE